MRKINNLLKCLIQEDSGGEVLEYSILLGLVVVGVILVLSAPGPKIVNKWTSISNLIG